jgi:hypothetical protein
MHFREATAADRDRILALRARCFGDVDREKLDPRFWEWEFANARIFVGEENGEIVTHLAIVHGLAVDAMTSPDARGKGAFTGVARYAAEHGNPATAYQIRGAVLGSMLRSGWTIADRVPVLLRPAGWWRGRRETFRTLGRDDAEWMSSISHRTPEFIRWRFFDNPHWQYDVTASDDAYLVARKTQLKGFDTYAVVDVAGRSARLLRDAVEEAKAQRCTLIAALVSRQHPAFGMFLRRGFLPGPHRFRLLVRPPEAAKQRWQVLWADTDHL